MCTQTDLSNGWILQLLSVVICSVVVGRNLLLACADVLAGGGEGPPPPPSNIRGSSPIRDNMLPGPMLPGALGQCVMGVGTVFDKFPPHFCDVCGLLWQSYLAFPCSF